MDIMACISSGRSSHYPVILSFVHCSLDVLFTLYVMSSQPQTSIAQVYSPPRVVFINERFPFCQGYCPTSNQALTNLTPEKTPRARENVAGYCTDSCDAQPRASRMIFTCISDFKFAERDCLIAAASKAVALCTSPQNQGVQWQSHVTPVQAGMLAM
jgi:hypothetical protein